MLGSKLKGYKFKPHTGHGRFSELGQFHLSRFLCIPEYFGGDTKSRRSLLYGFCAGGSEISHIGGNV